MGEKYLITPDELEVYIVCVIFTDIAGWEDLLSADGNTSLCFLVLPFPGATRTRIYGVSCNIFVRMKVKISHFFLAYVGVFLFVLFGWFLDGFVCFFFCFGIWPEQNDYCIKVFFLGRLSLS